MKINDYDIVEDWEDGQVFVGYEVRGFVGGNFFGVLGTFRTEDEAREIADQWAKIDHSGDARVRS